MTLKQRVDALDGGRQQELTFEDWVWILEALDDEDPVAYLSNSRRSDLAPLMYQHMLVHGDKEREDRRIRMEKAGKAWPRSASAGHGGGS